ncbi:MAG TPA: hypothetical protein VGQ93_08295, partial [Lysobacter sp.]|nr:hypothetical protein [Lysobacter sp.]
IDDLIVPGMEGYSLTRAFGRGVFEMGDEMMDTYFVFMNADFVVSNGAFETLLRHIRSGARAIVAPSLRSIAEETLPLLNKMRDQAGTLTAPPRNLVAMALEHLHPTAAANVIGPNISHNAATNQFFWWVDNHTLLGHFFLLFMFCIRPERVLTRIDGFCDYAFVPELCPSGNVTVLDDSDQCFLLEVQAHKQEGNYLQFGSCDLKTVARHLSIWTTAHHRRYSRIPVLMHTDDRTDAVDRVIRDAGAFMDQIRRAMTPEPQSPTNHPYWIGACSSAERLTAMRHKNGMPGTGNWATDDAPSSASAQARILRRIFRVLVGTPPHVNCLHYDWIDYRKVRPRIEEALRQQSCRVLFVAPSISPFDPLFATVGSRCQRIDVADWLGTDVPPTAQPDGPFDFCFIHLAAPTSIRAARIVAKAEGVMRHGAPILAMLHDESFERVSSGFSTMLLQNSRSILPPGHALRAVRFSGGLARAIVRDGILKCVDRILQRGLWRSPGAAFGLAFLLPAMLLVNLFHALLKEGSESRHCSSLVLEVRADPEQRHGRR